MPMSRADSSNMFCSAEAREPAVQSEEKRKQGDTHVAERDADELAVFCPLLDVVGDDGHVLEVERGVNLVEEVERCRLREGDKAGRQSRQRGPPVTRDGARTL